MSRSVIAVDIDEVLLPHFQDLITWYNSEYGTSLTLEHNHPVDPKPWGTDNIEVAVKRVHRFFETDVFLDCKPFDDALAVLQDIAKDYDLVIITARDTIIEDLTRDWLSKHFPGLFQEVQFTSFYSLEGKRRSKASVAKELNAKFLIDDDLGHCSTAQKEGIRALLFGEYPWNTKNMPLPDGIVRVKNWPAVKEYLDAQTR